MPPSKADRYAILVPLAIWVVSLFLPSMTYGSNDWFFPGRNSGLMAAFMSLAALIFFLASLGVGGAHDPSMLFFLWFGVLWFGNVLIAIAPFLASAVRRRTNLGFVIALWVWPLLALPLPLAFRKGGDAQTEYGSMVWIVSLFAMALLFTGYYAQGQTAARLFAPKRNGKKFLPTADNCLSARRDRPGRRFPFR